MQKSDYLSMIVDNVMVFAINLPTDFQENNLHNHLGQFDEKALAIIAGFNKSFLEHFLIISKGKSPKEIEESLKKMEKISFMIGPTGSLNYLGIEQVEYILTKVDTLALNEITEESISIIGDEHLENQFGASNYGAPQALESQLASASFYLVEMGYTQQEIQEKLNSARGDPGKLDALFNLPQKEIMSLPPQLQGGFGNSPGDSSSSSGGSRPPAEIERSQASDDAIEDYIEQIQQDYPPERAAKIADFIGKIKEYVNEVMTENHEKVFMQIHPDRLSRAFKMIKDSKKKSKRIEFLLEWFFCSHLIESIEFKVEHWQVSSAAGHGRAGVYTAGILFSRYDQIVKEFSDDKLAKVVNIARRILETPSKNAIQKLGQDLVAETGFDEHLYFTD